MAQSSGQSQSPGQSQSQSQSPSKQTPNSPSSGGEGNSADAKAYALNTTADANEGKEWGKLPPKVAKDIIEARRQGVAPEYRSAIESYYKAIADRARKDKK